MTTRQPLYVKPATSISNTVSSSKSIASPPPPIASPSGWEGGSTSDAPDSSDERTSLTTAGNSSRFKLVNARMRVLPLCLSIASSRKPWSCCQVGTDLIFSGIASLNRASGGASSMSEGKAPLSASSSTSSWPNRLPNSAQAWNNSAKSTGLAAPRLPRLCSNLSCSKTALRTAKANRIDGKQIFNRMSFSTLIPTNCFLNSALSRPSFLRSTAGNLRALAFTKDQSISIGFKYLPTCGGVHKTTKPYSSAID